MREAREQAAKKFVLEIDSGSCYHNGETGEIESPCIFTVADAAVVIRAAQKLAMERLLDVQNGVTTVEECYSCFRGYVTSDDLDRLLDEP